MILSNTQNKPKRHIKGGWVNPSSLPKNKDGMTQCRWCSGSVLPPRRTFCSDECVHQHRLRTNSTYLRTCVYKRDNGICAICHQDTKLIARQAKKYKANKEWKSFYKLLDDNNIHHKRKIWARGFGGGLWDADHIKPVYEGGGSCGLDNIRTLCIACHKKNTATQATDRSKVKNVDLKDST